MSVSIVFARAVVSELQQRGLDGGALLRDSQIDPARLANIHESLQPDEMERITRCAVEMTDDPALGLAVGAADPENAFQLFGQLLRVQPTVRAAFAAHTHFSNLIARGPTWSLAEKGDLAYFTLKSTLRPSPMRRFMMEYAIVASMRLCRSFFPRPPEGGTSLRGVHFQHAAPPYVERYRQYFRCPLTFDQPANAIIFPREILDRPQVHADPTVDRMVREAAERLLQGQQRASQLHERVRLLLRYSMDVQQISAERVARRCGLTLRTLRRHLALEGHSLSALVDEARCRVACDALLRDDLSLPEVAEMVGFSEASAFFRAFKRWTGRTPGEFRRATIAVASGDSELAGDRELAG